MDRQWNKLIWVVPDPYQGCLPPRALFCGLLHCNLIPQSFPAHSRYPCHLTYVDSLFLHCFKHMPLFHHKRIYHLQHENQEVSKYPFLHMCVHHLSNGDPKLQKDTMLIFCIFQTLKHLITIYESGI